ncbi:MAG TPA: SdpI family protein [Candidatus Dojkabacteria bacterium]|nr:SdpI family protein [Candidatus Dojkabacteria bacterium]
MKNNIIPFFTIFVSIFTSFLFYNELPVKMASHWNAQGIVDGYSSRVFNVLFFPLLEIFLFLLLTYVPKLDPKKKNIKLFESNYSLFISIMMIFMYLVQLQVFLWNIDIKVPIETSMPILMGILFIFVAHLIQSAKQNYTIGIRTPWTLASEKVWDKTHALGAKLFRVGGILTILSSLIPKYSFISIFAFILAPSIYLFIYSYLEFKKEIKE